MRRVLVVALIGLLAALGAAFGTASAGSGDVTNPNDPVWSYEWGQRLTRASDLWQLTTGDPKIVIAVVDTGLSQPLFKIPGAAAPVPDLTQVLPGWDIVGNDTNTGDDFGHGTWVSSVIGATGDNGFGMAGYCWKCSILPVRVAVGLDREPAARRSPQASGGPSTTARASSTSASPATATTPASSAPSSTPRITACSSSARPGTAVTPPRSTPRSAIPASSRSPAPTRTTPCTAGRPTALWVSLGAPGCSEVLDEHVGPAWACGSSFAPPVVSGIAGLLMSLDPSLTVNQITDALRADRSPGRRDRQRPDRRLGGGPLPRPRAGESTRLRAAAAAGPAGGLRHDGRRPQERAGPGSTWPAGRSSSSSPARPRSTAR